MNKRSNETQRFLVLFKVLDSIYPFCKDDDLGGLLGVISPELMQDGEPIDIAVTNEWDHYCESFPWNISSALDIICGFLRYYHEEYGFDYSITLSYIENNADRIDVAGAFFYQIEKNIERLNHTERYNKYGCFNPLRDELFWEIYEELLELEQYGEIVSEPDKKPISYLRELLQNDGPEWSYMLEFWHKDHPENRYKIGVCVRGAPTIQRVNS